MKNLKMEGLNIKISPLIEKLNEVNVDIDTEKIKRMSVYFSLELKGFFDLQTIIKIMNCIDKPQCYVGKEKT